MIDDEPLELTEPVVAEAVGVAHGGIKGEGRAIEEAMSAAIQQAYNDGYADDPEKVREYIQAARAAAKAGISQ